MKIVGTTTMFNHPMEAKYCMSLLGSLNINGDSFIFDGLKCRYDQEYGGIYFDGGIPEQLFKAYHMEKSIYGNTIFDLEGLVLLHTALCGQNIKEKYNENLENVRRKMLEDVIDNKQNIAFNGKFSSFDKYATPFLRNNFDKELFLKKCNFITTGYCETINGNQCIRFIWNEKSNPSIQYSFIVDEYAINIGCNYENPIEGFHQSFYHSLFGSTNKSETIKFFYGNRISIFYDSEKNMIVEEANLKKENSKVTDFKLSMLEQVSYSFIDKSSSFEKISSVVLVPCSKKLSLKK